LSLNFEISTGWIFEESVTYMIFQSHSSEAELERLLKPRKTGASVFDRLFSGIVIDPVPVCLKKRRGFIKIYSS